MPVQEGPGLLACSPLPRGARGPRGAQGSQGPQGTHGLQGGVGIAAIGSAAGPAAGMCANGGGACQVAASVATCPSGVVVGGGYSSSSFDVVVSYEQRVTGTTFEVIGINYTGTPETIPRRRSVPSVQARRLRTQMPGMPRSTRSAKQRQKSERRLRLGRVSRMPPWAHATIGSAREYAASPRPPNIRAQAPVERR